MTFTVSVIIPVYNAAAYIEKAVQSALSQPETAQVLIVNDGSTDQTDTLIKELSVQDERITILYHPEKENRGRAASRNLGIKCATQDYIAFLDADDFYLENRFTTDKEIFFSSPETDGVYNAIGAYFYREHTEEEKEALDIYMVSEVIPPETLFKELLLGKKGHFSIDGLTLKRSVFSDVGFFNENLPVAEDTELMWRITLNKRLVTGSLQEIVAKRGVHETNIFDDTDAYKNRLLQVCEELLLWIGKNNAPREKIDVLLKTLWNYRYRSNDSMFKHISHWAKQFVNDSPRLFFTTLSIKYFPIVRRRKELFSYFYKK